ncbi:MAG: hypothetical protein H7320_18430 [Ferruginibacter sp.]|nr:hypothetical protein [Ferruginibacter sp.]
MKRKLQTWSKGKQPRLQDKFFGWLGVPGFIGLIIGYNYAFSKTKSKYTGKRYYTYDEPSRDNGTFISIFLYQYSFFTYCTKQ